MNNFDKITPDTYESLPAGLAMAFAQRPEALGRFTNLSTKAQDEIIRQARNVHSKSEMRHLVDSIEHGETIM